MSEFLSWMPSGGWQRLMVDALWQSSLVGAVGLIVARALNNRAAARAWVLLLALSACLVVPLASWAARSTGWTLLPAIARESASSHRMVRQSVDASLPPLEASTSPTAGQEVAKERGDEFSRSLAVPQAVLPLRIDWMTLIAIAWLAASMLLLTRLMLSIAALARLVRRGATCQDERMAAAAAVAARRVGLTQPPRLLLSERVTMPLVLALGRPTILLPASECAEMGEMNWTAVFAHELGHVVRRDGWSRLWVQLITIVLPLSPLVWLARRAFFAACEEACDDIAVAAGNDPIDLAATLTAWIDRVPRAGALVAIGMSSTKTRTLRLLALRANPQAYVGRIWRGMTIGAAIVMMIGLAILQTSAKEQPQPAIPPQAPGAIAAQGEKDAKQPAGPISIAGTCVDEQGAPIVGATVKLFLVNYTGDRTQRVVMEADTNDKGHYGFLNVDAPGVPKQAAIMVIAQFPGRATASTSWIGDGQGVDTTLKMPPAGTMRGRVTDADGKPIAGAIVSTNGSGLLEPIAGICAAVSDADGRYEITDLRQFDLADQKPQPAGNGMFTMYGASIGQIRHPDYARESIKYTKVPSTVDVTMHRAAVVAGQVLLGTTGQAAMGARLEFWNDEISADSWTRAVVDELGEFRLAGLPPGTYRLSIALEGYPNLFSDNVVLNAGPNRLDLHMEKGGVIRGRVIDLSTEKPIVLGEGETMQISESTPPGARSGRTHFAGMNYANIKPDGTFTLPVTSGQRYLGTYLGPHWQGVNTDRLLRNGIEVGEGQTIDLEIRVRPLKNGKPLPQPLPRQQVANPAEQAAVAAINRLGGWVTEEKVDGEDHVVDVNMVFHDDERQGRQENLIMTDEALPHIRKFTKLKRLMLKGTQATDTGLANLRGMESLEQVRLVDAAAVTDAGAAHLGTLPNLTGLSVNNGQLTDESLLLFSAMPKLESIDLQGNRCTDKGLEYIQDMTQLKSLYLGLGKNEITDAGLRYVAGLAKLEAISLPGGHFSDAGLVAIKNLTRVKSLQLGAGNDFTDDGLVHLSPMTNLQSLDLQGSKVTDAGLAQLRDFKNLRTLMLSGDNFSQAAIDELKQALPNLRVYISRSR